MQGPGNMDAEFKQVARWRTSVGVHRQILLTRHRQGTDGFTLCGLHTKFHDELVLEVLEYVRAAHPAASPFALCATGSYGRREMAPRSDVDLLFLFADADRRSLGPLIADLTRMLWDAGVEVPHAARTVDESLDMAARDATIRTTLLDARFLAGDEGLYRELDAGLEAKIRAGEIGPEIPRKPETGLEPGYPAGSIAVLEPDLKESPGTLRDYHVGLWTARVRTGARTLEQVEEAGMVSRRERIEVAVAVDFLLRLRNAIHFAHGTKKDRLVADIQEEVAADMGYVAAGREQAIEALLGDYYRYAATVFHFSRSLVEQGRAPREKRKTKRLEAGIHTDGAELFFTRNNPIARDPSLLIRIFRVAAEKGLRLSDEARRTLRAARYRIDDDFRERKDCAEEFRHLLASDHAAPALREMHETEILDDYLPEFGALRHLATYDVYHRFTVDEHTLLAVHFFEHLADAGDRDVATLADLYRRIPDREAVKLAILIHDTGKAGGPGHTERSLRLIPLIAHRLHLDERTTRKVGHLVRHHMLMNELALKRDIHDVAVLRAFVGQITNERNLNRLYLLTYADMKAVGPGVWNPWKAALLEELYHKARQAFAGPREESADAYYGQLRDELTRELEGRADPSALESYFARLPERFVSWLDPDRILWHLEVLERFDDRPCEVLMRRIEHVGYHEILVASRDRQGLFSRLAGVVSAQGLNILGAQVFTRTDGVILDTFQVEPVAGLEEPDADKAAEKVRADLTAVLEGRREVKELIEKRPRVFRKRGGRPVVTPSVSWDNGLSDAYTVIEVIAGDRPGLLYEITDPIREAGLSIYLAKINTEGHRIVDVFYLTGPGGGKVADEAALDKLVAAIRDVVEQGRRRGR